MAFSSPSWQPSGLVAALGCRGRGLESFWVTLRPSPSSCGKDLESKAGGIWKVAGFFCFCLTAC